LQIFGQVSGTLGFENLSGAPVGVGGYGSGHFVGALVPWQVGPTWGPPPNPAYIPPAVLLPAYDGTTDYGGTSGVTHTFAGESGDGAPSQYADVYMDVGLQAFSGIGTVAVSVGPVLPGAFSVPPGIVSTSSVTTDAYISVRYEFDPFPASICRAAPWSGCPCGNSSAVGNGCGNSANANGGGLASTGSASISNDTLTLAASGMTNSNSLFFQGTTMAFAQIPYGDGLRCVTGSIRRLGTASNVGGAAQVPSVGGTPIAVQGQVTQPGTRYYQVFYRDAQNYCTSATYNVTSGLAILWTL
jgi:hypothetical protein